MRRRIAAAIVGLALCTPACGGADDAASAASDPGGEVDVAVDGRTVANQAGCSACHGTDGRGGSVGPSWEGLAGSTVTLEDGSNVVADAAYLRRAIVDPPADVSAGYTVQMPLVDLSDEEVTALVAYIQGLE